MIVYLPLLLCLLRMSIVNGYSDAKILKSSLTFVIDNTGSMSNDIEQVKLGANSIFETVMNSNASQIENFLLVTFNDPSFRLEVNTKNRDDFIEKLNSIVVYGGDDCPEFAMSGIKLALEESLRGSYIFVFTDASAKDFKQYSEVKSLATKMQSKVVFVLTGVCDITDENNRSEDYQVYYDLANVSFGQVFHMEKQEIAQILEYVKYIIKEDKTTVFKTTYPPGYNNILSFTVDSKQKDVAISMSGDDPSIYYIKGSDGSTPETKDLMKTSKVAIVQLLERRSGRFEAKLGSKSKTDVVVTAATSFNFIHGFSLFTPSSLNDTTTKPVIDTKSYLAIKLLGDDDVKLQTVKIVDLYDNIIKEMPAKIINDKEKFYLTERFQPPNTLFKIAVTGNDTKNNEMITRTGPPVEPQSIIKSVHKKDKIPTITIEGGHKINAEFNKPLQLKCKVNGYPEPKIIWTEKETGVELSKNVSVIELGSEYINILNIDRVVKNSTYQCTAYNKLGKYIESVSVQSEYKIYLNVVEPPKDTTIEYNKEGKLTCIVEAFPSPTINWILNGKQLTKDENFDISDDGSTLTIKKMQPEFAEDKIICEVKSQDKKPLQMSARLSISDFFEVPTIDKSKKNVYIIKGSNATVPCKIIKGNPRPDVKWYIKRNNDSKFRDLNNTEESLNLTSVDSFHVGTYKCIIKNQLGDDKYVFNISVVYAPTIEETIKKIESRPGQVLTLKCNVDGVPTPTVEWYKDDKNITITPNYSILEDNSLQINVTATDTGKFVCKAKNNYGSTNITTEVNVLAMPKIEKSVSTIYTRKGYDVPIHCKLIEGNPTVTIHWKFKAKGDNIFRDLRQVFNQRNITIHNVDTLKSGAYKCIATNILGKDKHIIDLAVVYPPEIEKDIDEVNVTEGEDIRLLCQVDGIPTPEIEWLKDGTVITTDSKIYKRYSDHSLRHTFSIKDGGNYTCVANNSLGAAAKIIKVNVFVPVNIILPNASTINSTVGDSVTLECQAEGFPSPDIEWIFYSLDANVPNKTIKPEAPSSSLILNDIESAHQGFYMCVASNNFSSANTTYELIVFTPPVITNIPQKNDFYAVDGDLTLRIPCNATGNPKPSITWIKDLFNIATGSEWYDVDANGTLLIKNIDEVSRGTYTCQAENIVGTTEEFFEVFVVPFPEELSAVSKTIIEKGTSAPIKCDVPHKITDSLRWYKDRKLIKKGNLTIDNATIADAGIYACRVSNFSNSSSASILVEIGFKPKFIEEKTTEYTNIDLKEGTQALLNCNAIGKPEPNVSWWHNDKEINATNGMVHAFYMQYRDGGKYYCNISNQYGSIHRTFVIESKDCFLKINQDIPINQPLLIQPFSNRITYSVVDGYLRIPKGDYVSLSCPRQFTKFKKTQISAICEEKTNFKVRGKRYKFSDFECTEEIKSVAQKTGECYLGSGEKIEVAFQLSGVTVQMYEICLDKYNNIPIYAKYNIDRSAADKDLIKYEWLNSDLLPLNFNELYDCKLQKKNISLVLGKWFHRYDHCCFFKRQLVNPRDMVPGLPQKATFNHLNVVPQWSTCNNENWNDMERKVRALAKSIDHKLLIWTGTSYNHSIPSITKSPNQLYISDKDSRQQPIPQFLWKVIQDPRTEASLAIIQVNVPDVILSDIRNYVLCPDICTDIPWMEFGMWHDITRGYMYCCTIQEFVESFEYYGIFEEKYSNILRDVAYF